jgi:hypothetical protein
MVDNGSARREGIAAARLFPGFRPDQRHSGRPDPLVEHGPGHQPRSRHSAPHSAHPVQCFADHNLPAEHAGQVGYRIGALAPAILGAAIDGEHEAAQLMKRAPKDGDPLAACRGVGGHAENYWERRFRANRESLVRIRPQPVREPLRPLFR